MTDHQVVSRQEWEAAREKLLQREKEHTRMADELATQRRELPWVVIEKEYRFDTDDGTRTLAGLFNGRSQLMLLPLHVWTELQGAGAARSTRRWPMASTATCRTFMPAT